MSLWKHLHQFDEAALRFASATIHDPPSIDVSRIDLLLKLCGRCVLPVEGEIGNENPCFVGQSWERITNADQLPALWKFCALEFRNLVDGAIRKGHPRPAYFSLLLDFDETLTNEESTTFQKPGSFSFAAFDHDPATAIQTINEYIGENGFSTAELLYHIEQKSRRPIVVSWTANGDPKAAIERIVPLDTIFAFIFSGEDFVAHEASAFSDPHIQSALQRIYPGEQDLATLARQRYTSALKGYLKHVKDSSPQQACSGFVGLFIPAMTSGESRSAVFFLYDASESATLSGLDINTLILLARALTGTFNDWQRDLRAKIATEFCASDPGTNDAIRLIVRHYQSLLSTNSSLATEQGNNGFWGHDHIDLQWQAYSQLTQKLFRLDSTMATWTAAQWNPILKALFQITEIKGANAEMRPGCKSWPSDAPRFSPGDTLTGEFLTAVFKTFFEIGTIEVSCCRDAGSCRHSIPLPMQPGLPFLLSLRYLISLLRKHEPVRAEISKVSIVAAPSVTKLTIHFESTAETDFGLGRRWLVKASKEERTIHSGICGAVLSVMSGTVPIEPTAMDNHPDAILSILRKGEGIPICGVRFGPCHIDFIW